MVLIGGPILLLFVADRAIVLYQSHWEWVARETPPQQLDPYRVEAILRTTEPGWRNVFILGDSTAEAALDTAALDGVFARRGLRFKTLSIGNAPTVTFGFLANDLLALHPSAVVLVVSPYNLRDRDFYEQIYTYDVRVVPALFAPREILAHVGFHLRGLIGQANVLFRHQRALQRTVAIRLGVDTWTKLEIETLRAEIRASRDKSPFLIWAVSKVIDDYQNPNMRAVDLLARSFRKRGTKFVVVESAIYPLRGQFVGENRASAFRDRLDTAAKHDGFTFIAAPALPHFTLDDFRDQTHLNEAGRSKFTNAIAQKLGGLL
jgi:hypothetical protein